MQIKHGLEQDLGSCKFIQLSTLHRLITRESVRAHLDCNRLGLGTAQLQDIATKACRLFAILVLLDRGAAIKECLEKNFLDGRFPVYDKDDIPDIDGVDKQALYDRQWQIPIVLPRSPHLNLPDKFIAPFLPSDERQPRHGSFGFVFKERVASGHLEHHESSEYVALKVIRKDDKNDWDIMMREVETLRARRHEYIVPLLSSWTNEFVESERPGANLNLLFPFSSMTLGEWLNLSKPPRDWEGFDPEALKDYISHEMKCLCSAVAFLHKEIDGLISSHHDLKPENILVFGKDWKIADFGRTHLIRLASGSDTEGKSGLGSFTYHPPEYWNPSGKHANVRHGRAFDVWGLGCIFVESLTIAVHGWEPQALRQFKQKRRVNTNRRIKNFLDRSEVQDDYSYHNNMNIVTDWMRDLERLDRSSRLIEVIKITNGMLSIESHDRPLSWEVYLNLDELLNPNKTNKEKEEEAKIHVQRPNRRHPKTEQNPLHRSAVSGNEPRVKCLLNAGWSDYPVDMSKLEEQHYDGIVKMLMIAKLIRGIRWRRVSARLSRPVRPSDFEEAFDAYDKLEGSSPLSYSGKSTEKATIDINLEVDEQGMTKLHHYCKGGEYWKAKSILEKVSSVSLPKLLICEDSSGMLPIHHAAESGSQILVEELLECFKLDANTLLLHPDKKGRTPLHKAAQNGDEKMVRSLLWAHRDRKHYAAMRDKSSKTARDLARQHGCVEVENLLAKTEHLSLIE